MNLLPLAPLRQVGENLRDKLKLMEPRGLPSQIHISITDRCTLPCNMCDIWRIKPGKELSTREWKAVFDQIAHWAGQVGINFAGGEPFLRRDLVELITYGKSLGFTISSNTNATSFSAPKAKAVAEAGLDILYLSLDGARPETHDRIRGQQGTWAKLMKTADLFDQYENPRIIIAMIINRTNISEIYEMVEFVQKRDYQVVFQPLFSTFGRSYDPAWYLKSEWFPREQDLPALDDALDFLIDLKMNDGPVCNAVGQLREMKRYFRTPTISNGLPCNAGQSDIALDPYGNTLLCFWLPPVGHVNDAPIPSIWNSRRASRRRWEAYHCPRTCNMLNCNFEHI